jgi:hypothetical protein
VLSGDLLVAGLVAAGWDAGMLDAGLEAPDAAVLPSCLTIPASSAS